MPGEGGYLLLHFGAFWKTYKNFSERPLEKGPKYTFFDIACVENSWKIQILSKPRILITKMKRYMWCFTVLSMASCFCSGLIIPLSLNQRWNLVHSCSIFSVPNVDLSPLCSWRFRSGPPGEEAQVASQFIADVIEK